METSNLKNKNIDGPILIMVRGLPGSGKSYFSSSLSKYLGKDKTMLLNPDTVDSTIDDYKEFSEALTQEGLDKAIHPFRWLRKNACDGVETRKIVIWNQPFTVEGIFDRLVQFIQKHAGKNGVRLPVLVVEINTDQKTAYDRIQKRKKSGGHGPSYDTFLRRVEEYKSFAESYTTITINGTDDVTNMINETIEALGKLSA